jgi:hypothetical protein
MNFYFFKDFQPDDETTNSMRRAFEQAFRDMRERAGESSIFSDLMYTPGEPFRYQYPCIVPPDDTDSVIANRYEADYLRAKQRNQGVPPGPVKPFDSVAEADEFGDEVDAWLRDQRGVDNA